MSRSRRGRGGDERRGRYDEVGPEDDNYMPVCSRLLEEKIEQMSSENLLLWIMNDRGFEEHLKREIVKPRILISSLRAILRAMESRRDGNVSDLLIMVRDSAFFKSIPTFLTSYFYQLGQNEMTDIAKNLICLLDIYMRRLPTDSAGVVKVIVTVLTPELEKLDKVPDIVNEKMQVIKESIDKGNNDKLLMNTTKEKLKMGFSMRLPHRMISGLSASFRLRLTLRTKKHF